MNANLWFLFIVSLFQELFLRNTDLYQFLFCYLLFTSLRGLIKLGLTRIIIHRRNFSIFLWTKSGKLFSSNNLNFDWNEGFIWFNNCLGHLKKKITFINCFFSITITVLAVQKCWEVYERLKKQRRLRGDFRINL